MHKILICSYILYALMYSTKKPFSVLKSKIAEDLNLSLTQIGSIDFYYLIAYTCGQLFSPILKMKPKLLMLCSLMLTAFAVFIFGFGTEVNMLLFSWVLNGVGSANINPLMIELLSKEYHSTRGKTLAVFTTSQQVGSILASLLTAYGADKLPWNYFFFIPGLLILIAGLFYYYFIINIEHEYITIESGDISTVGNSKYQIKELLCLTDLFPLCMGYFCVKCVRYCLLFWLPYYFVMSLKMDVFTAGLSSLLFDIGGIPGALFAGYYAHNSGRRVFISCVMTFGASILLLFFSDMKNYACVILTVTLIGFCIAGPDSIYAGAAANDILERSSSKGDMIGAVSGFINGCGSLGAVFQAYISTNIAFIYGWKVVFQTMSLILLLSIFSLTKTIVREKNYKFLN